MCPSHNPSIHGTLHLMNIPSNNHSPPRPGGVDTKGFRITRRDTFLCSLHYSQWLGNDFSVIFEKSEKFLILHWFTKTSLIWKVLYQMRQIWYHFTARKIPRHLKSRKFGFRIRNNACPFFLDHPVYSTICYIIIPGSICR